MDHVTLATSKPTTCALLCFEPLELYAQRSGDGTYSWADGRTYTGEWERNTMHGPGLDVWQMIRVEVKGASPMATAART